MAPPRPGRLLAALLMTSCVLAAPLDDDIGLDELIGPDDGGRLPLQARPVRQAQRDDDRDDEGDPNCSFGSSGQPDLCDYANPNMSALSWRASTGENSNWLGGPPTDADLADDGGYAFFETSSMPSDPESPNTESAMLESPRMGSTGPNGKCLKFEHSMNGLSVDRLRVLLHPVSEEEKMGEMADHRDDIVLWSSGDTDGSGWEAAQQLYTYSKEHTLVFEAIPLKGPEREYRGHIAIDSVRLTGGLDCDSHCTFDGTICSWSQDDQDDFQWSRGRGTTNPKTGPVKDHGSSLTGGSAGGYVYIDSSYPRRPGDRARLLSRRLPATGQSGPMCFRFWTHMHGPGVGTLRVLRLVGSDETELWKLSGPSGNQWYQGHVPVTATEEYAIAIEAEVGLERLGDVAIDDVSLTPGVCPSEPQAASPGSTDCTFETDECGWTNPGQRERVDKIDWRRITGRDAGVPRTDHTRRSERGFMLQLPYADPQRAGDFAWLVSPSLEGRDEARCLTFRYYMDATIPSIGGVQVGSIRVLVEYVNDDDEVVRMPLWSVRNAQDVLWKYGQTTVDMRDAHKIIFEGTWGGSTKGAIALDDITFVDGECDQEPAYAAVSAGDCDFTRDSCGWSNRTTDRDSGQRWRPATEGRKPRNLNDHTLRTVDGYAYFDAFNSNKEEVAVRLISPVLEAERGERLLCVAFWYAALSRTTTATLNVIRQAVSDSEDDSDDGDERVVWSLTAAQTRPPEVTWLNGEVEVAADSRLRVIFEGRASDYGFALDDISLRSGSCRTRPPEADPDRRDEERPDSSANGGDEFN